MGTHWMIKGGVALLSLAAAMCVTGVPAGATDRPQVTAPTISQDAIEKTFPAGPPAIEAAPSASRHEVAPERELGKGREVPLKMPEDEGAMFLPLGLRGPDARDAEITREQDERSATSF